MSDTEQPKSFGISPEMQIIGGSWVVLGVAYYLYLRKEKRELQLRKLEAQRKLEKPASQSAPRSAARRLAEVDQKHPSWLKKVGIEYEWANGKHGH